MNVLKQRSRILTNLLFVVLIFFTVNSIADSEALKEKIKGIVIDDIEVTEIKESSGKITINGTAKDNKLISSYMRKLDKAIGSPNLENIKRDNNISIFSISIKNK